MRERLTEQFHYPFGAGLIQNGTTQCPGRRCRIAIKIPAQMLAELPDTDIAAVMVEAFLIVLMNDIQYCAVCIRYIAVSGYRPDMPGASPGGTADHHCVGTAGCHYRSDILPRLDIAIGDEWNRDAFAYPCNRMPVGLALIKLVTGPSVNRNCLHTC